MDSHNDLLGELGGLRPDDEEGVGIRVRIGVRWQVDFGA